MDGPEQRRRASPTQGGRVRLPVTQPSRGAAALGLYALAIVTLTLLLVQATSGYALLVLMGILATGLIVPFLVLGQRPDAPDRAQRPSFPVLGTALNARNAEVPVREGAPDLTGPRPQERPRTADATNDQAR